MILTQTAETGIKVMVFLARLPAGLVVPNRETAAAVGGSQTYMAKTIRDLVKAGLLRSFRGPSGGVLLARAAASISLLNIVEATQGVVGENYCDGDSEHLCPFHVAMVEVREAVIEVLSRWNLEQLSAPCPIARTCKIALASPRKGSSGEEKAT